MSEYGCGKVPHPTLLLAMRFTLMVMRFISFARDHTMMEVSRLPLATNCELGDQATHETLPVWYFHLRYFLL